MPVVVRHLVLALAAATAAAVATIPGAPPAVAACSCAGAPDLRARLDEADAAFVGIYRGRTDPLGSEPNPSGGRLVINQFDVESVQKGELGPTVQVDSAAEEASCGITPTEGQRLGLLLTRTSGGWRSGLCAAAEPDDLVAAASGRLQGGTLIAAVVGGLALVAVTVAAALGPGRAALGARHGPVS